MTEQPYARFQQDELILRDELAIDRTLLANENTLLAYLRSALTLLIAGVTFIHLFPQSWLWWLGLAFVPAGLALALTGGLRFRRMQNSIRKIRAAPAGGMSPATGRSDS
jgi:putative membrane protein